MSEEREGAQIKVSSPENLNGLVAGIEKISKKSKINFLLISKDLVKD